MKPSKLALATIASLSILTFTLSYSQKKYEVATCYNAKNQNVGVWICESYPFWYASRKQEWVPIDDSPVTIGTKFPGNCNRGTLVYVPITKSHAINTVCNDRSHRKPQRLFFRYKTQLPT